MKDTIDRKHNQSVASEKKVEKQVNQQNKALSGEIKLLKGTISKLSDVMLREFETLRDDFAKELSRASVPLMQRFN